MAHVLVHYTSLVAIIICILFVKLRKCWRLFSNILSPTQPVFISPKKVSRKPKSVNTMWKLMYVNFCVVWPETFLFCPLQVFIHFSVSFCTAHCALVFARDHAP